MLILAGVSLNALVGDNGIISQAQSTTIKQSIAVLEEFLQQQYIAHIGDDFENDNNENDLTPIEYLNQLNQNWFYKTNLGYVINGEYAIYAINKDGLPYEIKSQLKGGEAGNKTYSDYANLNDVYGVTQNLKVYYSKGGLEGIQGINYLTELGKDNPKRTVTTTSSGIGKALNKFDIDEDGILTITETKGISQADIDLKGESLTKLSELGDFPNLKQLVLKNASIDSLSGIEKCGRLTYVYFLNCSVKDYTNLNELRGQLTHLIICGIDDIELSTLCSYSKGIGDEGNKDPTRDYTKLAYLGIVGNSSTSYMFSTATRGEYGTTSFNDGGGKTSKTITNVIPLENLSDVTKKSVNYLTLKNNNLTTLEGIKNFENLYLLKAPYNNLINLSGLGNMSKLSNIQLYNNNLEKLTDSNDNVILKNLTSLENLDICNNSLKTLNGLEYSTSLVRLWVNSNKLGENTDISTEKRISDSIVSLEKCNKLYCLDLRNNINIVWIDYIKSINTIKYLWLSGNINMNETSFASLQPIINLWNAGNYPEKYELALINKDTINLILSNKTIKKSVFESYKPVYENSKLISGLGNVEKLKLLNINFTDDAGRIISPQDANILLNDVLGTLNKLQYLRIESSNTNYSTSNLSTIDFIGDSKVVNIKDLELIHTKISDLSNLNKYSSNLGTLYLACCDNTEFSFLSMQDLLNQLYENNMSGKASGSAFLRNYKGLYIDSTYSPKFRNLSNVIGIYGNYLELAREDFDLSGFTSLKKIYGYNWKIKVNSGEVFGPGKLILPESLEIYGITHPIFSSIDFSKCYKIHKIDFNDSPIALRQEVLEKTLESVKNMFAYAKSKGEEAYLTYLGGSYPYMGTLNDLNCLRHLKGLNIQTFSITSDWSSRYYGKSSEGLKYLTNVENIILSHVEFTDLNSIMPVYDDKNNLISGCPKLKTLSISNSTNLVNADGLRGCLDLKSITLYNCSISFIYGIDNLSKLTYLNVQKNSLMNISSFRNSEGVYESYNVLEQFVVLNGKSLKKLYISDNNFDSLVNIQNLVWTEKDF